MMIEPRTEHHTFQALLDNLFAQATSGDPLQKLRMKAWDHFLELGLPTKENEAYRYLRLSNLFSQQYVKSQPSDVSLKAIAPHILPECTRSVLVYVNGHFMPNLSNTEAYGKKVVMIPLNDAAKTYSAFLNNQWAKSLSEETDPFVVLNAALHRDGAFVFLPPRTITNAPLQVLNVIDTRDQPMLLMPRLHLFAGTQSQIDVVSTQTVLSGNGYGINLAADFAVDEEAHLRYTQVTIDCPPDIWHFDATRATLKRNSTFKTVGVTQGSATIRYDYRVALTGENSETQLNGVWSLKDKREAHTHVLVDHQAPHCRSLQLYKGVLNDFSHSSFEGKIYVRQAAQKTDAFQLNNNLLLSDNAIAYSKPNLEIFADDVKASHGSTVGQLDKEQLFYLKTRGYSTDEAKNLLIDAYCKEVINMITLPSLHNMITG